MNVLVTGASGLVGRALVQQLVQTASDFSISVLIRHESTPFSPEVKVISGVDLRSDLNWQAVLKDIDYVVHCAAVAHVTGNDRDDLLWLLRSVNIEGTLKLARESAIAGVRRFVFVSSIKVCGDVTDSGKPFVEDDTPNPADAYGLSKLEAEIGLRLIEAETDIEVVIVRPPLVYGPGVKANFNKLVQLVALGLPLPLGSIGNKRSYIAIDNLVDFLIICLNHPKAAGETFFVSDGCDLSTTDLVRRIAKAMNKKLILFPFPVFLLNLVFLLFGKRAYSLRLFGSLQANVAKSGSLLGWSPHCSIDDGLKKVLDD